MSNESRADANPVTGRQTIIAPSVVIIAALAFVASAVFLIYVGWTSTAASQVAKFTNGIPCGIAMGVAMSVATQRISLGKDKISMVNLMTIRFIDRESLVSASGDRGLQLTLTSGKNVMPAILGDSLAMRTMAYRPSINAAYKINEWKAAMPTRGGEAPAHNIWGLRWATLSYLIGFVVLDALIVHILANR